MLILWRRCSNRTHKIPSARTHLEFGEARDEGILVQGVGAVEIKVCTAGKWVDG